MTFVGFDLHKRYITACALDDAGGIIAEIRQLSTSIEVVWAWLRALRQHCAESRRRRDRRRPSRSSTPSREVASASGPGIPPTTCSRCASERN